MLVLVLVLGKLNVERAIGHAALSPEGHGASCTNPRQRRARCQFCGESHCGLKLDAQLLVLLSDVFGDATFRSFPDAELCLG